MKKILAIAAALLLSIGMGSAQTALEKVYDENINPDQQITAAQERAKAEGKFVLAQVGGNWCPWCLRFAAFVKNDTALSKTVADNFVYIHVNYNPRKTQSEESAAATRAAMQRLGNPARFGFPVIVITDGEGNILHTQDSALLESGDGYDREKVERFFCNWTPAAVEKALK